MKRTIVACLAVAALASAASATTSDCLTWTDPAGDVSLGADPAGPQPQLTPQYDLVGAELSASTSGVTVAGPVPACG